MSLSISSSEATPDARAVYQRYLISLLCVAFGLFLLPALFVLAIDPMQVFHRHVLTDVRFLTQERFQNAGLINNYLADEGIQAVVIGTSMSQNFLSSRVGQELGWGPTLRLTMSGGTPHELKVVLARALKQGGVRRILWEVHISYVADNTTATHNESLFPSYLYNDSVLDDLRYLFSNDAVELSTKVIKGEYGQDLDRLSYWMDRAVAADEFESFNGKDNLERLGAKLADRRNAGDDYERVETGTSFPNIDVNIFDIVERYPDVDFVLYLPPASTLSYALMAPRDFLKALGMRRYIVEKAHGASNLSLYAFDDVAWITGDLGNYKDPSHYRVTINDYILRSIRNGRHRLTSGTIDRYERRFLNSVTSYAIGGL